MPTFQPFHLPDVGEGLTEADIVEWKVAVGDTVVVNQTIVEIETAKSLVELPSPHAGVVSEILVQVGQTVDVGAPIIVIDTDPEGTATPADPGAGAGAGVATGADAETSGDVLVGYGTKPAAAGRRPRRGATPPAAAGPAAGVPVAPMTRPAGPLQPIPVQSTTVQSAPAQATTAQSAVAASASFDSAPVTVPVPAPASGPGDSGPSSDAGTLPVLAKPPVRKLAKDLGVDLSRVRGTGPGGIVTRSDVQEAAEGSRPEKLVVHPGDDRPWLDGGTVSADGRQTRVPVRSVRRRTAEAMVTSAFTAPHVTVFNTVDVTKMMSLVQRLREDREFADVRVTPLLVVAKALILAIRRHPEISAAWDDETQEIVYKHYINLGIAAATPRGLVVPNIKNAHRMSLHELAAAIGDLTTVARAGRTSVQAMQDGTVTITNVGSFGLDTGTPILNPGESAILAFGAVQQRPWVHKGKIKPRWVTQLALSFDHRLVDGELGALVLADVAAIMADPSQGLVWG